MLTCAARWIAPHDGRRPPAECAARLAPDPHFWLGGLLFAASFGVWLLVLSRLPVSVAYPLASLGYVLAAALGWRFLGESLDADRRHCGDLQWGNYPRVRPEQDQEKEQASMGISLIGI